MLVVQINIYVHFDFFGIFTKRRLKRPVRCLTPKYGPVNIHDIISQKYLSPNPQSRSAEAPRRLFLNIGEKEHERRNQEHYDIIGYVMAIR